MHAGQFTSSAPKMTEKSKIATAKTNVYSSSLKGAASANGNGHAKPRPGPESMVVQPEQAALLNNSVNTTKGLVIVPLPPKAGVFECPEESLFYCQCVEGMVVNRPDCPPSLVEFGAGDGSPVISALLKSPKAPADLPVIHAYEISTQAAKLATVRAASVGLSDIYCVRNSCFWTGALQEGGYKDKCLIANPPYIAAPDSSKLLMPGLWGGVDGANLTRDLLSSGFNSAMLLISAYSNPVCTLKHARTQGYHVADFLVQPLPFGTYSSQDVVRQHLAEMKSRGEAFYREGGPGRRPYYFLAGVLFQKAAEGEAVVDLSEELLNVMCAL